MKMYMIDIKKIVFIITDYGSFNNFLGDVAVALRQKKIGVYVISSPTKVIKINDKYDYKKEGILFYNVNMPRGFNPLKHLKASRKIHKLINEIVPDVVSIHFTTGIFTTTFIGRLKTKTIGTFHGLGYPVLDSILKKYIYKFVEDKCLKNIDEAWVLNKFDFDLLKSRDLKVPIFQIPTRGLGCNLSVFNPERFSSKFRSDLRKSLPINEFDFVIGFTGRYVSFKGFDKVVMAFKILKEEYRLNNIALLLIGGKDEAHPTGLTTEEEHWLKNNSSVFDIGFSSKVEEYLSITDLFVFPSEKEGMPVCIIEALAMNVPVITANARGCNDLIEDNVNGILLTVNSAEEIARQIFKIMQDKNNYNLMKDEISKNRQFLDRKLFVEQQLNFFGGN
ncbi:hypothetical protein HMPREF3127_13680 [Sphingobacterium sp. HMSC13C05]|nr:hypothetical protein HMPREF3127_13680 [Sphingobacterium sp. HMSC13C05]HAL53608.1 hypothetical protein [Sphingobacterium sp.]